ncbi:glycosyl hydrolase [Novipirellula herctigrandis]
MNSRFSMRTAFCCLTLLFVAAVANHSCLVAQDDVKRGLGAGSSAISNSTNSRWAYNWKHTKIDGLNGEFVPMFWSGGNLQTKINAIKGYGDTKYVLGFNEPELPTQANMTAENAAAQWKTISDGFAGTDIKLVSPAVSDNQNGRDWLADFMGRVADNGARVDEIAFHWYSGIQTSNPTAAANRFLDKVDLYHETYDRPIWVTEFAMLDYGNPGNFTLEQANTANTIFLETAIAGLESRDFVTRYAWWNHNNDSRLVAQDANGLYRPTSMGDKYIPTLVNGDTKDLNGSGTGTDMHYLRGGSLVNNGSDLGNSSVARVYALKNLDGSALSSTFGGSGDWGVINWGSVSVEADATLRKIGAGAVTWRNIDIYNDGKILLAYSNNNVNNGTLKISGSGTNAAGSGTIQINGGANLVLGTAADNAGFSLGYDTTYAGGSVTVDGVGISLTGTGAIHSQTTFVANKDFSYDGNLVQGGTSEQGIVKRGSATLTLNGDNTYVGYTTVAEGTLLVNGSIAGNDVILRNGSTLGGDGQIAADINVLSGIVAPGNSTGTLFADNAIFASGSRLELELASAIDFDRLVLSDSLSFDPDAILEIVLLDGYQPMVGDEFDILDFTSFSGTLGNIDAPSLANGLQWDVSSFGANGTIGVVSAVPEPATFGLLMLGMISFVARRRRQLS